MDFKVYAGGSRSVVTDDNAASLSYSIAFREINGSREGIDRLVDLLGELIYLGGKFHTCLFGVLHSTRLPELTVVGKVVLVSGSIVKTARIGLGKVIGNKKRSFSGNPFEFVSVTLDNERVYGCMIGLACYDMDEALVEELLELAPKMSVSQRQTIIVSFLQPKTNAKHQTQWYPKLR